MSGYSCFCCLGQSGQLSIAGSDTQWISYPTYSRKLRVFDADASTTSLIPVVGWVFLLGRSSMLLI